MLGVVVSRADEASEHVGQQLLAAADWETVTDDARSDAEGGGTVYRLGGAGGDDGDAGHAGDGPAEDERVELREFDDIHIELDGVADAFGSADDAPAWGRPDLVAFASRHAGETGQLLTAHHTGNFGPADYGGDPGDVARAAPNAHRQVIDALCEHAPDGYEVGMECTHHGPTEVGAPSLFVEVGSAEPQWRDADAATAVACAILDLRGVAPDAPPETGSDADGRDGEGAVRRHLVGFGGGHYVPRFERIVRETDWAVGHIAADWGLDAMGDPADNRDVLTRTVEESAATHAVVDGERPDLRAVVDDLDCRVVGETWVRETTGVDLGLVDALESALAPVSEGLRFGEQATETAPDAAFEVVSLPDDLLAEAQGIDQETARAAVSRATLAFETVESGNRPEGRAAVRDRDDVEALVEDLAAVLDREYETVEREDGAVVASEQAFDPERARTLGIPEGPKFGRLSAGESVVVDGEEIDPEVVAVERERRFPVDALDE